MRHGVRRGIGEVAVEAVLVEREAGNDADRIANFEPLTPGPTAATVPAASYPKRAGNLGCSRY